MPAQNCAEQPLLFDDAFGQRLGERPAALARPMTWKAVVSPGVVRLALTDRLDRLCETDTLALILTRAVSPRQDAASIAKSLLRRFGCLPLVLGATVAELAPIAGEDLAVEIKLFHETARRMLEFPIVRGPVIGSIDALARYLKLALAGQSRESFCVLFLDRQNHLLAFEVMGQGTVDQAPVYPREVMRRAIELASSSLCLAHNHPSGSKQPSGADIDITRKVVEAGKAIGVVVHDHFLVADEEVVSFRALGLM